MKNLKNVVLLFGILFAATSKNSPAQTPNEHVQSISTIQLIVVLEDCDAGAESFPIRDAIEQLLKNVGITLVNSEADDFDATITIKLTAKALSETYFALPNSPYGPRSEYYTGAIVKGQILFDAPGIDTCKKSFTGKINPPKTIGVGLNNERLSSRSAAPLYEAFEKSDFYTEIIELFSDLLGRKVAMFAHKDKNSLMRNGAAVYLAGIGDEDARLALIASLQDKSYEVRKTAVNALGSFRETRAVEPLIVLMEEAAGDPYTYRIVAKALASIGDHRATLPLLTILDKKVNGSKELWDTTRLEIVTALKEINDPAIVQPFINILEDKNESFWIKRLAGEAIVSIEDTSAVDVLIHALNNRNYLKDTRIISARALGNIKDSRATPHLVAILKDGSYDVDVDAIYAMGKIKDLRAVQPLIDKLTDKYGPFKEESVAIPYALGEIGDPRALEPLMAYLDSWYRVSISSETYKTIYDAILKFRDPVSKGIFISKLSDPRPIVAEISATALGDIKSPDAVEPLIGLMNLRIGNSGASASAVVALRKINDPRAIGPMLKILEMSITPSSVLIEIAEYMSELQEPRAVNPLISCLEKNRKLNEVNHVLLEALAKIGDKGSIKPVLIILKSDNYQYVDANIVHALVLYRNPAIVDFLVSVIKEGRWTVKYEAANVIPEVCNSASIQRLISLIGDEDKDTRSSASMALTKISGEVYSEDQEKWKKWWDENDKRFQK